MLHLKKKLRREYPVQAEEIRVALERVLLTPRRLHRRLPVGLGPAEREVVPEAREPVAEVEDLDQELADGHRRARPRAQAYGDGDGVRSARFGRPLRRRQC